MRVIKIAICYASAPAAEIAPNSPPTPGALASQMRPQVVPQRCRELASALARLLRSRCSSQHLRGCRGSREPTSSGLAGPFSEQFGIRWNHIVATIALRAQFSFRMVWEMLPDTSRCPTLQAQSHSKNMRLQGPSFGVVLRIRNGARLGVERLGLDSCC